MGDPAVCKMEGHDVNTSNGPLAPIRILDFSHIAAGPYATLQLAYFGAQVIKVESSSHMDGWRIRDGNADKEESRPFADHNKNKLGICINLKNPRGTELVRRLVAHCDIVVENFSFGVMERLGLGYEVLQTKRPDLIMVSLQGLGRTGPRRDWVTWGPSLMPLSGMTYLWNHGDSSEPVGSQTSYPDYVVGLHAATSILAALRQRDRTGRGCHVEISQVEITATMIGSAFTELSLTGSNPIIRGNQNPFHTPHGCYKCAGEDRWCVIDVTTDEEWHSLARLLGRIDLLNDLELDTQNGRRSRTREIDEAISAWTLTRTPNDVMKTCQKHGIPAGVVANGEDVASDPNLNFTNFFVNTNHPRQPDLILPGVAVHLSSTPGQVHSPAPLLGQHTTEVLTRLLDMDTTEIASLEIDGVLS